MTRLGILVSGSGTNLQAIIDAIERKELDAKIVLVISNKPGVFALERAAKHGIRTAIITHQEFPDKSAYDGKLVEELNKAGADLVILAGFMRILTGVMVKAFPMRIMNIHPSLLPAFPGLDVHKKAIDYGAKFSGVTVHFVDEGMDTGPIIIQAAVPIMESDTPEALAARILKEEHKIYAEAIRLYTEGRLEVKGRRVFIKNGTNIDGNAFLENPPIKK